MSTASAILTYHSLDSSGSVISVTPDAFRLQMESLAGSGIPVVPLQEAPRRPGSIAITFDDGLRSVLDHAAPALDRHQFPATVFVVAGFCGRSNDWPNRAYGKVPVMPLLTWGELASLPPAIALGAHSMTHPDLTRLRPEDCDRELRESRDRIEQCAGRPVGALAYPYGASSPSVRGLARRHFEMAVGTSLRFLGPDDDPMNLPRLDAYYFRGRRRLDSLFSPWNRLHLAARRALRETRHGFIR
jgi:peptidoglycan/xylan/chitin deacetylase (PgdA/CDA1 family)